MILGLRDLHWVGAAIPDPVLEYPSKNPRIHVYLSLEAEAYRDRAKEHARLKQLPASLVGTRNISSLHISVVYISAQFCHPITQLPLRQLLLSSPDLRALSLDIAHPRLGCYQPGAEREYCGFGLSNGESPPPLEELEIIGYPWGQQPAVSGFGISCPGYPEPTGTEMEYWAQNFDWLQLRRLRLHSSSVPLAAHLAPQLTALEEIELGSTNHDDDNVLTFFDIVPSTLTSISLPCLPASGISTITAHAAKLHTLSIHHSPLTNQDLALLRDALSHLDSLTVVCARDRGMWPYDALSMLAGFPRLRSLTIWFDIGPPHAPHEPYLTVSSTRGIFTHLRQHGASKLRRLRVYSGFPPRPIQGYPGNGPYWARDNVTSFICQVDHDKPEVSCPKLSRAQDGRLRRVARGSPMTEQDKNNIKFLVALRRPMRTAEWLSWQKGRRSISDVH